MFRSTRTLSRLLSEVVIRITFEIIRNAPVKLLTIDRLHTNTFVVFLKRRNLRMTEIMSEFPIRMIAPTRMRMAE